MDTGGHVRGKPTGRGGGEIIILFRRDVTVNANKGPTLEEISELAGPAGPAGPTSTCVLRVANETPANL